MKIRYYYLYNIENDDYKDYSDVQQSNVCEYLIMIYCYSLNFDKIPIELFYNIKRRI